MTYDSSVSEAAHDIIICEATDSAIEHVAQGLTLAHLDGEWDVSSHDWDALRIAMGRTATAAECALYRAEFEAAVRYELGDDEPEEVE